MKRLIALLISLLWIGAATEAAFAQTTNLVAASGTISIRGNVISTGTLVAIPVLSNGQAISVTKSGGGLDLSASQSGQPLGYTCAITAGAVAASCPVPDELLSKPSGFRYNLTFMDTSTGNPTSGLSATLNQVSGVTGATFNLATYDPSVTMSVAASTITSGSGAPSEACIEPALYIRTDNDTVYACYSGSFIQIVNALDRAAVIAPLVVQSSQDAANTPTSTWYTTTIPATPGNQNLVAGVGAGTNLYTGSASPNYGGQSDVVLGYNACAACTTAREGVYIGANAAAKLTGGTSGTGNTPEDDINIAIGSDAMAGVTSAGQNVVIGQKSAVTATTLNGNVLVGIHTVTNTSSLTGNAVFGNYALDSWAGTMEHNTIVGSNIIQASASNSDMQDNTLMGYNIGGNAWTTAARNVIAGSTAVPALTTGSDNIIFGFQGARSLTTGTGNILLGSQNAPSLTTGTGNVLLAAGGVSGNGISTGSNNFCVFAQACNGVIAGNDNIMLGVAVGQNGADTSGEVLLGHGAGFAITNVGIGSLVAIGYQAAQWISSGGNNTALGTKSLANTTTESGNVGVGNGANTAAGVSNSVELGTGNCATSNALCFAGTQLALGQILSSASATPGSIAANSCVDTTFSVANAPVGAIVGAVMPPTGQTANIEFGGAEPVITAGSITLRFCNVSASAAAPVAGVYTMLVAVAHQ